MHSDDLPATACVYSSRIPTHIHTYINIDDSTHTYTHRERYTNRFKIEPSEPFLFQFYRVVVGAETEPPW